MRVESKSGASVRITMLSSCQSGCDFCHLEGHKSQHEIGTLNPAISKWRETGVLDNLVTLQDIKHSIRIAHALNLTDVNLTGGEPTLHPNLTDFINLLADAGLNVAMTTHAEIAPIKFREYLHSGLSWVIISLHAINPEQYVNMDLVAQKLSKSHSPEAALKYAKNRLRNKLLNIDEAVEAQKNGTIEGIITNTVMLNLDQTKQIISYCNAKGIIPRVQRDLNEKIRSQKLIDQLIDNLNAVCVKETRAIGDSSGAGLDYTYQDPISGKTEMFRLKDFGDVYVKEMCDGCKIKDTVYCRERFYGVRIEPGKIRTCIDIDHKNLTTFDPEEFLAQISVSGSVPAGIYKQYQRV